MKRFLNFVTLLLLISLFNACNLFQNNNNNRIDLQEGMTDEQLEAQRYAHKIKNAYKDKHLYQQQTDNILITLFNVITYQIKEEGPGIGDGFTYYIIDLGIENKSETPFDIATFTKNCKLSTSDSSYLFSNVSFALNMYSLQTDSSALDSSYIQNFHKDNMPSKEFYRAKLFAYEVSNTEKDALFFRYNVGNKKHEFKIRDKQP